MFFSSRFGMKVGLGGGGIPLFSMCPKHTGCDQKWPFAKERTFSPACARRMFGTKVSLCQVEFRHDKKKGQIF